MVFGDFDADGLTGLAIMVRALRWTGLDVEPYVPSRLDEGHGLSLRAVDAAEAAGQTLIVTVDTGSSSGPEIAEAARRGIDVIVTDHHRLPPELPPPRRSSTRTGSTPPIRIDAWPGAGSRSRSPSSCSPRLPGGPERAIALAELATIGTVADVAPILGENRAIARLGLDRLRSRAVARSRGDPRARRNARRGVDLETVAFVIAPRLNAAGRVGDALEAAQLLLTDDPVEAAELAGRLQAANLVRRDLTKTGDGRGPGGPRRGSGRPRGDGRPRRLAGRRRSASSRVGWPRSAAARRSSGAEVDGVIRASCRSGGGFDLGAALAACSELFIRHGGHAGAAGFELAPDRWESLPRALPGARRGRPPALV